MNVDSTTIGRLIPSTPMWKYEPMAGIHDLLVPNW